LKHREVGLGRSLRPERLFQRTIDDRRAANHNGIACMKYDSRYKSEEKKTDHRIEMTIEGKGLARRIIASL
jgi:hypothetical protein